MDGLNLDLALGASPSMGGGVPPLPAGFSFLMLNQAYVTDDAGRFIVVEN